MYVNLRRYPRVGVGREAVERSVKDELLPELQKQDGFIGYCTFWDEEDAGVSVSIFEDAEAAHRSTDTARRWVMRHQDYFPERFEEFSGECIAHEVSQGLEQEPQRPSTQGGGRTHHLRRPNLERAEVGRAPSCRSRCTPTR